MLLPIRIVQLTHVSTLVEVERLTPVIHATVSGTDYNTGYSFVGVGMPLQDPVSSSEKPQSKALVLEARAFGHY